MSQEANQPLDNESIRAWTRRVRVDRKIDAIMKLLGDSNWPVVVLPKWTELNHIGDWLETHVGREHFLWVAENFWFTNEADAVAFKLTWLEAGQ